MKKIHVFLIFNTICVTHLQIINNDMTPNGYQFSYKTDDSERMENGVLDESKGESGIIIVSGSYSFIGTDGRKYSVKFVADENGYRPLISVSAPAEPKTKVVQTPFVPYVGSAVIGTLVGGGIG